MAFTGRAAILAVVVGALAIALAGPVRELLSQRSQIASLRTSVASQQSQIATLNATKKLWGSPAYIETQARDRLHYVFPGQVPYVTLSPTPLASSSAAAAAVLAAKPWYGRLWSSVEGAADGPTPRPSPSPTPALASSLVVASEQAIASQEVVASESALEAARSGLGMPSPSLSQSPSPSPSAGRP
jgi:cell division protein FtsB